MFVMNCHFILILTAFSDVTLIFWDALKALESKFVLLSFSKFSIFLSCFNLPNTPVAFALMATVITFRKTQTRTTNLFSKQNDVYRTINAQKWVGKGVDNVMVFSVYPYIDSLECIFSCLYEVYIWNTYEGYSGTYFCKRWSVKQRTQS